MPIIERMFDEQIKFKATSGQKTKLYAEAARQHVSGADLLRGYMDSLPEPAREPEPAPAPKPARRVKAA